MLEGRNLTDKKKLKLRRENGYLTFQDQRLLEQFAKSFNRKSSFMKACRNAWEDAHNEVKQ